MTLSVAKKAVSVRKVSKALSEAINGNRRVDKMGAPMVGGDQFGKTIHFSDENRDVVCFWWGFGCATVEACF